ncbi:MAG: ankyrin repeat domain-containing protein, partial [Gammaproteobacteria bacterium]
NAGLWRSWACHGEIVKRLIAAKAGVNKARTDGATPLLLAAQDGYSGVVKQLIEAGADVNKGIIHGVTPLLVASENGHAEVVKLLLAAKADMSATVDHDGTEYTALSLAKMNRHANVVTILKDNGAVDFDLNF